MEGTGTPDTTKTDSNVTNADTTINEGNAQHKEKHVSDAEKSDISSKCAESRTLRQDPYMC